MSRKFAVFDIDGTLIRWQLYHAIVNRLAAKGEMPPEAYEKIRRARMSWKNRSHNTAFEDYEMALVQEWLASSGALTYKQYLKVVDEVVREYINQTYTYTRDLIKKLKKQGYFLLTISGSPKEAVEKVAKRYGFDDFVAAEFGLDQRQHFTGKNFSPIFDKAATLNKLVRKHKLSWVDSVAVGDTASDVAMLELVQRPIAFNPERELAKIAMKRGWPIVVERKNVVYKLSADSWKI
ncbi:HAD family phosphatase [Candidatus Saccharibacteria bacterium]|nr:HAD family phosphatase [Candidatus Saccharibacteria bacterium]